MKCRLHTTSKASVVPSLMATGIETVGLVLGAIPIVIAALDHYNSVRSTWKDFTQKSLRIKQLIQGLEEQKVLLEMELELLLRRVGALSATDSPRDLTDLLETVRQVDTNRNLKIALGRAFEPYTTALEVCETSIERIAGAISGLIPGHSVSHPYRKGLPSLTLCPRVGYAV